MPSKIKPKEDVETDLEAMRDLMKESDRSKAIMLTAALDDSLRNIISMSMSSERLKVERHGHTFEERLFEENGPLSSFAAKIDIAFAYGLIDKIGHDDFHIVRQIRNVFAHFRQKLSFSDPRIDKLCQKLESGKKLLINQDPGESLDGKAFRIFVCTYLKLFEQTNQARERQVAELKAETVKLQQMIGKNK